MNLGLSRVYLQQLRTLERSLGSRRQCMLTLVVVLLLASSSVRAADELISNVQSGFIPNQGQFRAFGSGADAIQFAISGSATKVYFRQNGFSYLIPISRKEVSSSQPLSPRDRIHYTTQFERIDVDFVGANTALAIVPNGVQSGVRDYCQSYLAQPLTNVPSYSEIRYKGIYDGIDVVFRSTNNQLKYDFVVAPGADPSRILLHTRNTKLTSLNEDGELQLHSSAATITEAHPISYQELGFKRREVRTDFDVQPGGYVRFHIRQDYDRSKVLVIDPAITWSTYYGGNLDDVVNHCALDHRGNLVVCGYSSSDILPSTGNVYNSGEDDFFVAMFNPDRTLYKTTYWGGPKADDAFGIAIDKSDNIFICGQSASQDLRFAANVFQAYNSFTGSYDAFIMKFNLKLDFVTGTFIGGTDVDIAYDIALDSDGNPAMCGYTYSANFKTLNAIMDKKPNISTQDRDAFVCAWTSTLGLRFSTYYGGNYHDEAFGIAIDNFKNIYVGGRTESTNLSYLDGGQKVLNGTYDAFILELNGLGINVHATLFGGEGGELFNGMSVYAGRLVCAGLTTSNRLPDYGQPDVLGRFSGSSDGLLLVTDLNLNGKWAKYVGGGIEDLFNAVCFSSDSGIVAVGFSSSPDFPYKRAIFKPHVDSIADMIVCKFNATGQMLWSTGVGGTGIDYAQGVCTDQSGNAYVVGLTNSRDFPMVNAIQPVPYLKQDGIVMKICPTTPLIVFDLKDTVMCAGGSITLTAEGGLSRYLWSTGEKTQSIVVHGAGTYFYSADSQLGCNAFSDTIRIKVRSKLPAEVRFLGKTTLCPGDSVLLYSRDQFDAFSWRDSTGKEVGTKDSLYVKQAGAYHLLVSDKSGCHDSSLAIVVKESPRPNLHFSAIIDGSVKIDSVAGGIQLCQGQNVQLSVRNTSTNLIYWSNGAVGPSVNLGTSARITAALTDTTNCIWTMDTIDVQFNTKTHLQIQSLDSSCIGTVVELRAMPPLPGASYRWIVDGGTIYSRADSGVVLVAWNSVGTKNIKVMLRSSPPCIDTGSFTIRIQDQLKIQISPQSGLVLCPGSQVVLNATPGYPNYFWNGQAGSAQYTVSTPGMVRLLVDNGAGCQGTDSVLITQPLGYKILSQSVDFDTVKVDSVKQMVISVVNVGSASLTLTDFLRTNSVFAIDSTVPPILQAIAPGDTVKIYLSFTPRQNGAQSDSLVVKFRSPCSDSTVLGINGFGKSKPAIPVIRFRMPDLTFDPLVPSSSLPIYAWVDSVQTALVIDSLIFDLEYNPLMLRLQAGLRSSLQNLYISTTQRERAHVSVRVDSLFATPRLITELPVAVLLGDRSADSIRLSNATIRPLSVFSTQDIASAVRYTGLCTSRGTRLLGQAHPLTMTLSPNPVSDAFHVSCSTVERGHHALRVVDEQGTVLYSKHWEANADSDYDFFFSSAEYANGLYLLILESPTQQQSARMLILR